jgi:uncharacterized protein (TIGR01777 family)
MEKVLITGATGLVGNALVRRFIDEGVKVHFLTTKKSKLSILENCIGFLWKPRESFIDLNCLDGVDTIINLAGASIAQKWTKKAKEDILTSRTQALQTLAVALKRQKNKVTQLITASAIGLYPDSLTAYYEENSKAKANSFLSQVVTKWEGQLKKFDSSIITISILRIGIVLDSKYGALPKLVAPIKNFIGAPIGCGQQWQSWIHIDDLSNIFFHIYANKLEGIYNAVAPNPVRQIEFVRTVARVLQKPLFLPNIPEALLKFFLGDMSALVLESQRVSAKKISNTLFEYKYINLEPALNDLLLA